MHSDVLIVGAGSAGSVLAERLSADPARRVTVVESGPGPSDPRVVSQISDGLRLPIGTASSVVRHYTTTLTEQTPRRAQITRGAVVGGSGAINGGYFCRGLPEDFDGWGLPGWAWSNVLPHFQAIETDLDFANALHGADGPILVRRVSEFDGCTASFVQSAAEAGHGVDQRSQRCHAGGAVVAWNRRGPAQHQRRYPSRTGRCFPAAGDGSHQPHGAHQHPGGTTSESSAAGRSAVDCVGSDGAVDLTADRIVLCAGAIGSAHLLMLSGVGPEAQLRPAGVSVHANLPVGTSCVDHPEWVLPIDWPATHGLPPLEAVLTTSDGLEIRPYTAGFDALVHGPGGDPADRPHIGVALMQPRSRGRIRLASADPAVPPIIEHRYDSEPEDVEALRVGADMARELGGPTAQVGPPSWSTSQHLSGTAPMGAEDDPAAVLDPQCRVRGVDGLWVVDGSVLPAITSRGPHATIVMIGHRAAEFIV